MWVSATARAAASPDVGQLYYLSPGWLRIDPIFASLKGNPLREARGGEVAQHTAPPLGPPEEVSG